MVQPGSETVEARQKSRPAIQNRRRTVRQRVHLRATAKISNTADGTVLESQIIDLSEDGACIQTSSSLQPKTSLIISLDLDANSSISTSGEVIWGDGEGRHGIHFSGISEESRQKIKQWLFANAVSIGINQARNLPAVPETIRRKESRQAMRLSSPVRQSPEQIRAEIAASANETEIPVRKDYSAILSALVAVKREAEVAGTDLDRALQLLAERALSLTKATGAAIAIASEAGADEMICRARAGSNSPAIGSRLQAGSGFSGECVRSRKVLLCDDAESDSRVDPEGARRLGIRSMMAAPIWQGQIVVGLLEVFSSNPNSFGLNDQKVLERLSEMIGASMDRSNADVPSATAERVAAIAPASIPTLEMLPATEPTDSRTETPIAIARLLETETSSRKILFVSLAAVALMVVIWLALTWAGDHKNGNKPAQVHQGVTQNPTIPAVTVNDLDKLRKLAADGDPNAQFDLGARYATGEDLKQDYGESVRWFNLAAEQGHVIAQATLGAYYWAGRGIPQDLNKAYFWSAIAQAGGDEASKYRVAVLATRMTHEQVAAAQRQAANWIKKHQPSTKPSPQ